MAVGRRPTIFGDGLQSRDFTYVGNAVQALLRAADAPGVEGNVYNVGTGGGTSLNDLVGQLNRLPGTDLRPMYEPARTGDVRHSRADLNRARRDLGYGPAVTFRDGLSLTLDSLRRTDTLA
jgi:UDP-glucose 4-epimerase